MFQGFGGGDSALSEAWSRTGAVLVQQTGRQRHFFDLLLAVVQQLDHQNGFNEAEHQHSHAHHKEHTCRTDKEKHRKVPLHHGLFMTFYLNVAKFRYLNIFDLAFFFFTIFCEEMLVYFLPPSQY